MPKSRQRRQQMHSAYRTRKASKRRAVKAQHKPKTAKRDATNVISIAQFLALSRRAA